MPKRLIDGEALWQSSKLGQVQPVRFRAEYANLIPLALANGSFECNPRAIWARVYATNRPDITADDVTQILDEFQRVKMLIRWEENGKLWGYWIGIEKGRLPNPAGVRRKHYAVGAEPPQSAIAAMYGQCPDNVLYGVGVGVGSGIGSGIGKTITSTPEASSAALRAEEDASALNPANQKHIALSGSPLNSAEKRGVSGFVFSSSPSDGGSSPRSLCAAELKRQMRSKRNGERDEHP